MSIVTERDIASLLRNDVRLVNEWELFYYCLNLELNDTPAIEHSWNFSRSSFGLMRILVGQYVSEKGTDATVKALAEVLDNCNHKYIKDLLLEKFPATARIVLSETHINSRGTIEYANHDIPEITEEDKLLQQRTSGGVTIVQLVNTKQAGKGRLLVCINHLLNMLSEIGNRPVAIVSINGKQRSGKSFLANQFIKYLKHSDDEENWVDNKLESDFEWRGDFQRVTSGIQVWHEPIYLSFNGKETAVIVMDTQGLHDKNTGAQENAIIFGVSVLLSSVFIFNEKHVADDSLQYLRSYLEFAKFATGGQADGPTENLIFQKLILLIRDFQADEYSFGYYDNNSCPPGQKENLKHAIFELTPDMHEEATKTRIGIEKCFQDIGVYAMCGPGNRLPNKFKESSKWDPDFLFSIMDFVPKLFSPEAVQKSTKRVFGQEVSGDQLKSYVSKWIQKIQETDGMIHSRDIFETTAEIFYTSKIKESSLEYRITMANHLECNPSGLAVSELTKFHELLVTSIVTKFSSGRVLGGSAMVAKYTKQLLELLNGVKHDYVSLNQANIDTEEQRQLREKEQAEANLREEELRRQRQAAKELAIATAENQHKQALHELGNAQGKLQQVEANRYTYMSPVSKKKRHRFAGIHYDTTRYTTMEYDAQLYQQAWNSAKTEVDRQQQVVNAAEHQLNVTRNS